MSSSIANSPSILHRLLAFRERYGVKRAAYKFFDVVLHKLGASVYSVVWLDVESLAPVPPADPQFTFRFCTAEEVEIYAKDPAYFLDQALADHVRTGHVLCHGAWAGDRLAAFGCYILNYNEPELAAGVAMSYPPDVAFMMYGLTHADFRGARLHGVGMALALQALAEHGVTKLVSFVSWTNWASLKSCDRLGYIRLGNMIALGSRKRAIGLYPQAAKQRGVRFGRKAVRTQRVRNDSD